MNNKQASTIPTSMATTKSKMTVSTNEVTKTITSLLGNTSRLKEYIFVNGFTLKFISRTEI